ncbi:MAG: PadR family transcriptional regulator, regulatory protein PadR, partial [Actinomycetota bacterium]|nr:PadR family transcriptional regulator, regulatory protein PadR [Actinomycetota bacterium]
LEAGLDLRRRGRDEFHGFAIAKHIQELDGARRLTSHGTLYKARARMEKAGLLESRWEDPEIAAGEQRPRRRFYVVTGVGERALAAHRVAHPNPAAARNLGLEHM